MGGDPALSLRGMIYGVGHDLVHHPELGPSLEKPAVLGRLFAQEEIEYCRNQASDSLACFARRFAGKEAVIKALGEPTSSLSEIAFSHTSNGGLAVRWSRLDELGLCAMVSASSSGQYSSATAILVSEKLAKVNGEEIP